MNLAPLRGVSGRLGRSCDHLQPVLRGLAAIATAEAGTVAVAHADGNGTWLVVLKGEHDGFSVPLLDERTDDLGPLSSRNRVLARCCDP